MGLHRYNGSAGTIPFLERSFGGEPVVAPFSVVPGDVVDFGDVEPPADQVKAGIWERLTAKQAKTATPVLADNDPARIPLPDPEPEPPVVVPTDPPVDPPVDPVPTPDLPSEPERAPGGWNLDPSPDAPVVDPPASPEAPSTETAQE